MLAAHLVAWLHAAAEDRPQWGERWSRNMASSEVGLPESFDPGETDDNGDIDPATTRNVLWTATLGSRSYGSPVIADGRVLIGTNNDTPRDPRIVGDRGILMCLDEATGEFLWQLSVPKRDHERFFDSPKTGVSCTPTVMDGCVYISTNRGEIVCLDLDGMADGNDGPFADEAAYMSDDEERVDQAGPRDADIVWCFDMVEQLGIRSHDAANSCPLVHDGLVYVGTSNGLGESHAEVPVPEAPAFIVLDAATGQLLARDDDWVGGDIVHGLWSSPTMGAVGGEDIILYGGGNGRLFAFEPLNREMLLAEKAEGRLPRIKARWWFDGQPELQSNDGSPHEFQPGRGSESYTCIATPVIHDDRVYMAFSHDPWMGRKRGWFACIDPAGEGDITRTGLIWSVEFDRESLSSPAIADGILYMADNGGNVCCLDADTGRMHWSHAAGGLLWGSALLADGCVYVGTSKEQLLVFRHGEKLELLEEIKMNDPVFGSAVAAGGTLYIATNRHLYAIKKGDAP